ncbi:MAG: putative signal transduction response regulator [Nitrososphaeraceae archaeon]|jgi:DNA-binding response OmpR family regulator|nr:putative signal transduction response regulator [Nitrososphaeraceae archaeon]
MSSKGSILIVDDEIDITLAFKKGLESNGFLVDTYNDPIAALLNFKSDFYDLLLVDVRMPKMNGFELYQEIEKVDKKTKVCFITAFEVYYHALREIFPTLEVGCFIRKPIEIDDLVKRINAEIHSLDIDK